jgi:glucosamine--fructose-6-phosphate aminotransferase (isomerizing)
MTTIFEEEIISQADILRKRTVAGTRQATAAAATWDPITHAVVAARGSSDNAAIMFQYLAGQELGLLVALAAASLYEGETPIGLDGAGVLVISQSGRTPGMIEVLGQARAQRRPAIVVTNDVNSPVALASEMVVDLCAGPERALASSKTFSTTWHALAQLVEALKGTSLEGLDVLPDVVERVSRWALAASMPTSILNAPGGLTVVGRGIGFAVASEIALKVREVTGIRAEAFAAADYLHGPCGADGAQSTLLLVLTDELTDEIATSVLDSCRQMGMGTVVLRTPQRASCECDDEILIEEVTPNWLLGLAQVIVGQVLALRIGELRDRPIDTSPGLNKVTLTA